MRTILAFFAHPDDEAFGVGGTLALYASAGDTVKLICATAGEEGLNRLVEDDVEQLGRYREAELQEACKELGLAEATFLGYRDSGMAGTPTNDHPDSLHQADLDEVAAKIADIIRQEHADAVITFERYGWYGHPDHIKIYEAVRRAYQLLAKNEQPLLYCAAFAIEAARYSAHVLEEAGEEVPRMFSDRERMRYRLDMLPIVVDTSSVAERKIAALNAHKTQMGPTGVEGRFLPEVLRVRTDREYFMPVAHHDAIPKILPFERSGGLFGESPPVPLVPYPILPDDDLEPEANP